MEIWKGERIMEIDVFFNRLLIFLLFASLFTTLYLTYATQTDQFKQIFKEKIQPRIINLNISISGLGQVFSQNCTTLSTGLQLCVLKHIPTNDTSIYAGITNSLAGLGNVLIDIVNVPIRIIILFILLMLVIINFIDLMVAIISNITALLVPLDVFNFSWTGIIFLVVLLMVIIYLVWKLLEYVHGLV